MTKAKIGTLTGKMCLPPGVQEEKKLISFITQIHMKVYNFINDYVCEIEMRLLLVNG